MKITVITLFPKMIAGFFDESIISRAQKKKLVEIEIVNLRDFAADSYGTVDEKSYGGGVGMVLKPEPLYEAIQKSKIQDLPAGRQGLRSKILYASPKGKIFNQEKAKEYSQLDHLIIIAGHYEGVDERVMDLVDEEVSIGDFVLTGGEIPTAAIVDSIVRLIPGVLKKEEATEIESFFNVSVNQLIEIIGETEKLKKLKEEGVKEVKLLEYPQYTRPEEFMGKKVPEVLLSGNHQQIERWRIRKSYEETIKKRPDFFISD